MLYLLTKDIEKSPNRRKHTREGLRQNKEITNQENKNYFSSDTLQRNTKSGSKLNISQARVAKNLKNNTKNKTALDLIIQRQSRRNLPIMRKSSNLKLQVNHILDLISPAPVVMKGRTKTRKLLKNTFTHIKKLVRKKSSYINKQMAKTQV